MKPMFNDLLTVTMINHQPFNKSLIPITSSFMFFTFYIKIKSVSHFIHLFAGFLFFYFVATLKNDYKVI